jgi:4-hydroxy-tetrahydrodipicolinate synthase
MGAKFDRGRLRTVHLVPLTAFGPGGGIAEDVQARHVRWMAAAGMRVFLPAAGTSEFHSLSAAEIARLVAITREAAGKRAAVFAPVGLQIGHAIETGRQSLAAGADGVMVMPMSHPYLSDSGIRDYYRALLDALDCPMMLYKKAALPSDELLLELADDERVVGVKYAQNNLDEFRRTVLRDTASGGSGGPRTEWLCGSAERFAPFYMLAGSPGYTTGAGNLCPRLTLAMHAALAAGEYAEGMRLQALLLPIEEYRSRSGDSYNISMLKHAMTLLGEDFPFGSPRPPQRRLTDAERAEIDAIVRPILAEEERFAAEMGSAGLG